MTQPKRKPGRPPKNQDDDFDDLIGDAPAEKSTTAPFRGTGQPLKPDLELAHVYGGVTADWLAQVFGSDRRTVQKKLARADDAVMGKDRRGSTKYSIPHAAAYLIKPKVDIVQWIKGLRPNDLPPMLNDAYWGAMLKRQKWEENAGDLWRSEDVLEVFSSSFFTIKTTTQLWVEEIDRKHTLTPAMRETITALADDLLAQLHQRLIEAPKEKKTSSSIAEEGAISESSSPAGDGFEAV